MRGSSAGKGDAPRNLSKAFRENFPDTLTGNIEGLKPTGYPGHSRKVYKPQQVTRFGQAPHVSQRFVVHS